MDSQFKKFVELGIANGEDLVIASLENMARTDAIVQVMCKKLEIDFNEVREDADKIFNKDWPGLEKSFREAAELRRQVYGIPLRVQENAGDLQGQAN